MFRLRYLPALPLVVSVVVAAWGGSALARPEGSKTTPPRVAGVTLNTGPGGETRAFEEFLGAGARAIEAAQPWAALEPARGRLRLGAIVAIVQGVRSIPAMQIMAIPAAIETTARSVPGDLRTARWDSRAMVSRYRQFLRRLAPRLSRQVRFVSIANEADVYLSAHPRQLPAFLRFARVQIAELHRLVPWVKCGVTVTYTGLTSAHPRIARRLARLGDATAVTYYPLGDDYRMRSPRAPARDIPEMVRLAQGRPLVLQEAGFSSAPRLGGSRTRQATFVRSVFSAWNRFPQAIPFLSFYSLFDLPARDCTVRSEEVTFLCSLGLHDRNGRAKPAWKAFRQGVAAIP